MSPSARRILIPLIVAGLSIGIVIVYALSAGRTSTAPEQPQEAAPEPVAASPAEGAPADVEQAEEPVDADVGPAAPPDAEALVPDLPEIDVMGLTAIAPETGVSGHEIPVSSLGSLDPNVAQMQLDFSRAGAGIARIAFSDIWETASARRQADAYYEAIASGGSVLSLPDESLRYILHESQFLKNSRVDPGITVPSLSANQIIINGEAVNIFDYTRDDEGNKVHVWAETGPGQFETVIVNAAGEQIVRITRRFILGDDFDITIEQRLINLTGKPLEVAWLQYGPGDLRQDRSRYMDRRRLRFGYTDPVRDQMQLFVISTDNDLIFERSSIVKREEAKIWPNEASIEKDYELAWFGITNRYFGIAIHPVQTDLVNPDHSLADVVERILHEKGQAQPGANGAESETIFTYLESPTKKIAPAQELALDMGLYAGPLDRHLLGAEGSQYHSLSMDQLILYQMSSCCAVCTFQWLAHILLGFLSFLHTYVLFDWALAIIGLVMVVRTLLHPLTKKSQISMQRFGKVMQEIKPEIDKLQKKFPNDPKKLQAEQMKLMRERGANPMQMLGCLPMFLQTPIWIALYAMLYFVFDLRQQPAFFGLFQVFWDWPFLADLSAADHCLGEFAEPFKFLMWNVTGINVLPILMGAIFFVQQKYMSPPPSPTMTKEQISQQKMMKVMMVVMFPLMLYSAPSGLTLYILTSSSIGILESKYIRRHIKEMDLNPPEKKKKRKKTKSKDAQGRAYAAAIARMEEKRRKKQKGPEKTYKKRK